MLTVCELGHDATPESASLQVNDTVTPVLFQPKAFGDGTKVVWTFGDVLSMFKVAAVVAGLLAKSVVVPVTCWPAPSVEVTTDVGQVEMPEVAS